MAQTGIIFIWHNKRYEKISVDEIVYLISFRNYVHVACLRETFVLRTTMKEMSMLLPAERFCRIHRCHVVNLSKIRWFNNYTVNVGKQDLPIGKLYREAFLSKVTAAGGQARRLCFTKGVLAEELC